MSYELCNLTNLINNCITIPRPHPSMHLGHHGQGSERILYQERFEPVILVNISTKVEIVTSLQTETGTGGLESE